MSTVVGPFTRTVQTATFKKDQTWYRQFPIDYSKPLKYDLDYKGKLPGDNVNGFLSWNITPLADADVNRAIASARDRLNNAIGANAGIGVDMVEWRQSMDMIARRGMQMYNFIRGVRRGRFGDAYAAISGLSPRRPPRGLHKGKGFANNFLEWHFGWSPLINDIHDAVNVLQGPVPANHVRARSTVRRLDRKVNRWDSTVHWDEYDDYTFRCEMGADVYVSNPNLNLARQMGLVNPVGLAWEVVPFSFVVDWFIPVGKFLSQWTDFVGLTLQNAYTTTTGRVDVRDRYLLLNPPNQRDDKNYKYRYQMSRKTEILSYRLQANRFTGLSPMRGLTAIALVIQGLRGG